MLLASIWPASVQALQPLPKQRFPPCSPTPLLALQVDMWSAGVVLFILLAGYPPFYSESEPALFDQIRRGAFNFDDPAWYRISARCVLAWILRTHVKLDRPWDSPLWYRFKQILKAGWCVCGQHCHQHSLTVSLATRTPSSLQYLFPCCFCSAITCCVALHTASCTCHTMHACRPTHTHAHTHMDNTQTQQMFHCGLAHPHCVSPLLP